MLTDKKSATSLLRPYILVCIHEITATKLCVVCGRIKTRSSRSYTNINYAKTRGAIAAKWYKLPKSLWCNAWPMAMFAYCTKHWFGSSSTMRLEFTWTVRNIIYKEEISIKLLDTTRVLIVALINPSAASPEPSPYDYRCWVVGCWLLLPMQEVCINGVRRRRHLANFRERSTGSFVCLLSRTRKLSQIRPDARGKFPLLLQF